MKIVHGASRAGQRTAPVALVILASAVLVAAVLIAGITRAGEFAVSAPDPLGAVLLDPDVELAACIPGEILTNHDGSAEGAYAWVSEGVAPPEYGAFAECFEGTYELCAVEVFLAQVGNQADQTMDVFLWEDSSLDRPGAVIAMAVDIDPGEIDEWPEASLHAVSLRADVAGDWWVGVWGNWPGESAGWFVAADEDGPGGCPKTNIAPGIGYPAGWYHPNIVFGWQNCKSLAIGAAVVAQSSSVPDDAIAGGGASGFRISAAPNPFRDATVLEYEAVQSAGVGSGPAGSLTIHDSGGRRVRSLPLDGGTDHPRVEWNGRDDSGRELGSGIYFVRASDQESEPYRLVRIR